MTYTHESRHGAQGNLVNPESSTPVRPYKYTTRNRLSPTRLKITEELGVRKTQSKDTAGEIKT